MTTELYGTLPAFVEGQVFSASIHGNMLQRYVANLRDDVVGVGVPFLGLGTNFELTPYEQRFVLRHRLGWDTFAWKVAANGDGSITFDGYGVVDSWTGDGTKSDTVDISGLELADNEMVTVIVSNIHTAWLLAETPTDTLPTLEAFEDGDTPTAAQWQDLSDYALILADRLSVPIPAMSRIGERAGSRWIYGSAIHRARYLYFELQMAQPVTAGDDHINLELTINSQVVLFVRLGESTLDPATDDDETLYIYSSAGEASWQCYLDMEAYPTTAALAYGDRYEFQIRIYSSYTDEGTEPRYYLHSFYETTEGVNGCSGSPTLDLPDVPGYTVPDTWTHGDYVYGDGDTPGVVAIKDNLEALGACDCFYNVAAPRRWNDSDDAGFGLNLKFLYQVRRRRWLLYRTATGEECTVHYTYRGKTEVVRLPNSGTTFFSADLDAMTGLLPGTLYWLGGTLWAFEDVTPYV